MASRALQISTRRLALASPASYVAPRALIPAMQMRYASVSHGQATQVPRDQSMEILVRQRLQRPVAPHLTIYKPQITWILSSLNRITGIILSGGLYLFGIAYVAAPIMGWQISSVAIAAAFAKWSLPAKILTKTTVALPFMFHSFNGVRHLIWDTGSQITNKQVIRTGWTVVGLTIVSSLAVAFFA